MQFWAAVFEQGELRNREKGYRSGGEWGLFSLGNQRLRRDVTAGSECIAERKLREEKAYLN